ncbi:MAG: DUF393 domain-containing protein, partial [Sulfurovum sp.]|nr:DUF393 domain-containing protein [Sulfurovum sp.]
MVKDKVIIFDGYCGLCNRSVNIVLFLDKKKIFYYSSLQGEYIKTLKVDTTVDSIIYYEEHQLYYKSTA